MGLLVWLHVLEDGGKPPSRKTKPKGQMTSSAATKQLFKNSPHMLWHTAIQASALYVPRTPKESVNPRHTNDTQKHRRQNHQMRLAIKEGDSEADRPSGMSRKHRIHSRFYWFTEFCNSQCLSHFAAPFISVQAKTFITEGCKLMDRGRIPQMNWMNRCKEVMTAELNRWKHNECAIHPTLELPWSLPK